MTGPLLQLRHVTKTFGSLVANDNVDLDVLPGRVHALVGENGAGKTTLMSMINGTGVPDSGTIIYDGKEVSITTPQQAAALGIGMVFQHFKLVGSLTVAANVFLGREITKNGQLDTAAMEAEVTRLAQRFGLEVGRRRDHLRAQRRRAPARRGPESPLPRDAAPGPRRTDGGADAVGDRRHVRRHP